MDKYNSFIFDSFTFDQEAEGMELRYSLDDSMPFIESLTLPGGMEFHKTPLKLVNRAMFALHMIGGTSYYKTCCPKAIEVRSGKLTEEHANFWDYIYLNGLMEFFYKNDLNPTGLVCFPRSENVENIEKYERPFLPKKVLVPIGGGKDSIVTAEILKKAG